MKIDLIGIIDEKDYIRYSKKNLIKIKQLEENIASLKNKINLMSSNDIKEISNKEIDEKTKNFLKAEFTNKEILCDIVNRIEIDENRNIYIYFNFEKVNICDCEEFDND